MQKRQQFTAKFKREAVRLFKAGDRPAARQIGSTESIFASLTAHDDRR